MELIAVEEPSLVKLPPELLHHIISFVFSRPSLKRLLFVNKLLSSVAVEHLYATVLPRQRVGWLRSLFQSYYFHTCYYPYYAYVRNIDVGSAEEVKADVENLLLRGCYLSHPGGEKWS